ncbi:bifunctional biotin--[acetyl-CoA-carboxylase] ligase/biotin operon repressor BirA [Aliamphritea ceti]|uniref:bifunctional biotin--[acetyl-CoA-carboxylase] ligase/biotin operon repressor BirA n=1 Tax=Aliamphritea ceti TaxID=1524258 RepID=UPI0021C44195|nr:bifunctional biotin--[acetyl-CoA-carboxylase] ligase/biotin operon repressor BirA [Aliamphritea ceti]
MLSAILGLLADGKFHSGQDLGKALGVSRSAVWKQMQLVQELGLEVYSVKGRGYRIPGGVDLLSAEQLIKGFSPAIADKVELQPIEFTMPSTNAAALTGLVVPGNCSRLYVAEQQTAGRGRRGRQWVSPFASNLYFSLTWQFSSGVAALEGLSLVVGVALLRGLRKLGVNDVSVKWPNDLLWRNRKLAGVLLEMVGDASGECNVVVGIGMNVNMPRQEMREVEQPWVDLTEILGEAPSRTRVLATLINALIPTLEEFVEKGFSGLRDEWQAANSFQDESVVLQTAQHNIQGLCRGVNDTGALLLETVNGVEAFHGGEVSLRAS